MPCIFLVYLSRHMLPEQVYTPIMEYVTMHRSHRLLLLWDSYQNILYMCDCGNSCILIMLLQGQQKGGANDYSPPDYKSAYSTFKFSPLKLICQSIAPPDLTTLLYYQHLVDNSTDTTTVIVLNLYNLILNMVPSDHRHTLDYRDVELETFHCDML